MQCTMKEGRDPLLASQATDESIVFGEFVARRLHNFKSEINHTASEETIPALLFEIAVSIFLNYFRGSSSRRSPLKIGPIGYTETSVNNYQHMLRNSPEEQRHTIIFLFQFCRSQWLRGLRRRSSAARLRRLWVRMPIPVAVRSKAWVCGRSLTRIVGSKPIPVTVRSKASVCGRSLTRIVGSNPAGDMDVCVCYGR
jgi:hypothetical protein